jgi:hypothetical protein
MLRPHEPGGHQMVEEAKQRSKEAIHFDDAARLRVQAELGPGPNLEQLLEGAKAAGKAANPSASSVIIALRSCIEPTTLSSVRPPWPISRSISARGITPITSPRAARAASANAPMSPTRPPP